MARTEEMEETGRVARRLAKALRHIKTLKAKLVAAENELESAITEQQQIVDRFRYGIKTETPA
jgi:flagellin-like hook-associated protein FlgL